MKAFAYEDVIVCVVAHPDDAELLFFGSLCVARKREADVHILVVSAGESGISLADAGHRQIQDAERLAETSEAFEGTGVHIETLDLPDGQLSGVHDLASRIEAVLRRLDCSVLLTHDPEVRNDHQDHLAVGRAAINAGRRVECQSIYAGYPVQPGADFNPTLLVDVTEHLESKIGALQAHRTQSGRWYLGSNFITNRATSVGWAHVPRRASSGKAYEALRQVIAVDESNAN